MANVSSTRGVAARPRRGAARSLPSAPGLDLATLLGVLGAFAVILAAMVLGGSPGAFLDLPALLIVLAGSFLVTTISYTLPEVARAQSVMLRAVVYQQQEPSRAALTALALAERARRKGSLELQNTLPELRHDRFLERAVGLVADGLPAEEIERILTREREATLERHLRAAGVLRRAGEVAPAMGLIGTLVGLVQMLGHLEDPASIGPAMAVALLTTFYGAVLAHMVFLPLANKLERNAGVEAQVKQIYALGAVSMSRQENPRRLEMTLNTILAPGERVRFFK